LRDLSVSVDSCLFDRRWTAEFNIRRKATRIDKKRRREQTGRDSPSGAGCFIPRARCVDFCRFLSILVEAGFTRPVATQIDRNRQNAHASESTALQ
jgi:hypothetical protein